MITHPISALRCQNLRGERARRGPRHICWCAREQWTPPPTIVGQINEVGYFWRDIAAAKLSVKTFLFFYTKNRKGWKKSRYKDMNCRGLKIYNNLLAWPTPISLIVTVIMILFFKRYFCHAYRLTYQVFFFVEGCVLLSLEPGNILA